jgi:eukaryotic-like serine/threonine-protein kinase
MSRVFPPVSPDKPLGGRYQLISQLGAGGFGRTFLAHDLHLPGHPRCVIKQLKPQVNNDQALRMAWRCFNTEAQVLYQLGSNEQVPRLLAHFEDNQEFYLAQELIEGDSLVHALVEGKRWSQGQAIAFVRDILEVLAFVHQKQVIHRDIKPSNLIRRRQDGRVVLIDFGAVKQVGAQNFDPESGLTNLTISIGTKGYMPNEQVAGKPRFSSDIYAVGVIGIQALSGVLPRNLQEDNQGELAWHDLVPNLDPAFRKILDRMVRYDFRERYANAGEALAAISALQPELLQDSADWHQIVIRASEHPSEFEDDDTLSWDTEEGAMDTTVPWQPTGEHLNGENLAAAFGGNIYEEDLNKLPVVSLDVTTSKGTSSPQNASPQNTSPQNAERQELQRIDAPRSESFRAEFFRAEFSRAETPPADSVPTSAAEHSRTEHSKNVEQYRNVAPAADPSPFFGAIANLKRLFSTPKWQRSVSAVAVLAALGWGVTALQGVSLQGRDPSVMGFVLSEDDPKLQATELFKEAARRRQKGELEAALQLYDRAIARRTNFPEAHAGRCETLNLLKRPEEAIVSCNTALVYRANYPEALWSKGNAFFQQGKTIDALSLYEGVTALQGVSLQGRDPSVMGFVLSEDDPKLQATELFKEAARRRQKGELEAALQLYDRAIARRTNFPEAHAGRCETLNLLKRPEEAIVSCNTALVYRANYPEALWSKGNAFFQQGKTIDALSLYEGVTELKPEFASAWVTRGVALQKMGRSSEALWILDQALNLYAASPEAWKTKAAALISERRYPEAVEAADRALQLKPNDPAALKLRQEAIAK